MMAGNGIEWNISWDQFMKCAFTGHREIAENFDEELFERAVVNLITLRGADTFYDGMARGFDLLAARRIIELKKSYDIKLVACIPFGGQIDTLSGGDREIYKNVLEGCDDVNVLSAKYYPGCMYARNRFMVDNSDVLFAFYRGGRGGTRYTIDYAKKCGREIFII